MASSAVETPLLSNIDDSVQGNVDYNGRPVKRSKSGRWRSACFIIGVEMAERFAYCGISANLISYLTGPLGQSTATAAENINAWSGTAALLPLVGAFVADSFLGRYRTIIIASVLYILALSLLTISAILLSLKSPECQNSSNFMPCSPPPELQILIFFFSLYLVAIAQGLHKPCVQAFGADQFDGQDPVEAKGKSSFFNWWYISLCASITVTLVILTYIQENLSWSLGFGIPALVMVIALILFLLGTMTYRFRAKHDERNPFLRIVRVFIKTAKNWKTVPSEEGCLRVLDNQGSQQFKFLNRALLGPGGSNEGEVCTFSDVEEAKGVLRLFPMLATCLIYGIVESQSSTLFTKQGVTMDRSITPSFQVPAASLQSLITLTIVMFVLIYDRVLVPIARAVTRKPSGITMLQRIGTGLFLSCLTMVIAAFVEQKRLETARNYGLVDEPNATVPLSVAWLIPQYVLFGVSDSLFSVGLQEFLYEQMPSEVKSTGAALYLSIFGLGGFLSSLLISVIEEATGGHGHDSWFSDNLNKAHLDYFYWLLAGLSAAAFAAFLWVSKSFVYNRAHN